MAVESPAERYRGAHVDALAARQGRVPVVRKLSEQLQTGQDQRYWRAEARDGSRRLF